MKQRRIIAAVGFALVASVVAAACGGSSGDGSEGKGCCAYSPNGDEAGIDGECREVGGICLNEYSEAISGNNANQHYERQAVLRLCRHEPEGGGKGKVHDCGYFSAEKGAVSPAKQHSDCQGLTEVSRPKHG
mgnify:CR=1 FL=1